MMLVDAPLAKEAGKLYALPAGEFTAARNARAKGLRARDPELAAAVATLPKPTVAAAAVNRLARDQPSEVRELIQAGKRLRATQERALAGKGEPDDLQQAIGEHRAALERLQREARRLRLSDAVLERVVRTIRAASLDPDAQRLLERGLLAEELEAAGFALDPGLVVTAQAEAPRRRPARAARDGTRTLRNGARPRSGSRAAEEALASAQADARAGRARPAQRREGGRGGPAQGREGRGRGRACPTRPLGQPAGGSSDHAASVRISVIADDDEDRDRAPRERLEDADAEVDGRSDDERHARLRRRREHSRRHRHWHGYGHRNWRGPGRRARVRGPEAANPYRRPAAPRAIADAAPGRRGRARETRAERVRSRFTCRKAAADP